MQNTVTRFNARWDSSSWLLLPFLFWVVFLLVLEPGNVARANALGHSLSITRETWRILCAAMLGTAVTPVLLALVSRYPQSGSRRLRNAFWLLCALLALAGGLNVVSSFLAAWGFEHKLTPEFADVRRQLVANWALLAFALVSLTTVLMARRQLPPQGDMTSCRTPHEVLHEVIVKSGTRSLRVVMKDVEWIEAQGNYVALHIGDRMHLIRDTLSRFECRLNPDQFVRIHRGTIVPLGQIQSLHTDANGETTVQLRSGRQLAASRRYRKGVREKWLRARPSA
jgi:LytTr DNA-binding domain